MTRVAIVGGGPGGLMAAHLLERKCGNACRATLFEASGRLGGKIDTRRFDTAPVMYESGVAECYSYEAIGPDPLRTLVRELGLETTPIGGNAVVMDGTILRTDDEVGRLCGIRTRTAIQAFRAEAAALLPRSAWHRGLAPEDNRHPWAGRSGEDLLDEVVDPVARKYLKVAAHSDLATEPHLTSGLYALRKLVMTIPGYGNLYSIDGGMDQLPRRLVEGLTCTDVQLNAQVARLTSHPDGGYSVHVRRGRTLTEERAGAVIIALPHNALHTIEWIGEPLRRGMASHIAAYDWPGHYLRISLLFDSPFWRSRVTGSWFMLDAFGGCCVYDEGGRHNVGAYGVLGWLLAGADALAHCNADNETLVRRALESLPDDLYEEARVRLIEGKVHRWAGAVCGLPGGIPIRDARRTHQPDVAGDGLFVVGDYLFESTLNGVLRSAGIATDLLEEWLRAALSCDAFCTR